MFSIGNFAHSTGFLSWGKALLKLIPLYLQMLIMQISSTETKKSTVKKWVWSFETLNSTFYAKKYLFLQNVNTLEFIGQYGTSENYRTSENCRIEL